MELAKEFQRYLSQLLLVRRRVHLDKQTSSSELDHRILQNTCSNLTGGDRGEVLS